MRARRIAGETGEGALILDHDERRNAPRQSHHTPERGRRDGDTRPVLY